jgi:hypothetical protein
MLVPLFIEVAVLTLQLLPPSTETLNKESII